MTDDEIPRGWRRINEVCMGAGGHTDDRGKEQPDYTVFHTGVIGKWVWEAWYRKELIAEGLGSSSEGVDACRRHWVASGRANTLMVGERR